MSRARSVVAMAGVALMAGAVGWAIGVLAAPASGQDTRRRLAWRAEEELKHASRSGRAFLSRAVDVAKEELARRQARIRDTIPAG